MSDRKPWHKMPTESPTSRRAFRVYLELGPMRSQAKTVKAMGRPVSYKKTLERWSVQYDWVARAAEYDEHMLNAAIEKRQQVVETAVMKMQGEALDVTQSIIDLARGVMTDGDTVPVFDKFGNEIGDRPAVPAQVRLQAAVRAQECAGIIPPKRVEMSGLDGKPVEAAIEVVHTLDTEELRALVELTERFDPAVTSDDDEQGAEDGDEPTS